MPIQTGIRVHDMKPVSLEQRLALAHEQGFSCVHLASKMLYQEYHIDHTGLTPGLAAHLRRELSKNDLNIALYGCYLNLADPDESSLRQTLASYYSNIRFASYLNAPIVGTETGAPNSTYTPCPECRSESAFNTFIQNLKTVLTYAASFGITIAIEPVVRHIIYDPIRTRDALDAISSPNLQVIFDPVNLLSPANHHRQQQIFDDMLRLNGKEIVLLHAKDYTIESDALIPHAPGSIGNLDYTPILRWQSTQKPYLQATIENSTPENAVQARKFLETFPDRLPYS